MSSDARAYLVNEDDGWNWAGFHDGECEAQPHEGTLSEVIEGLEKCMGQRMRWYNYQFKNGLGLRGYLA